MRHFFPVILMGIFLVVAVACCAPSPGRDPAAAVKALTTVPTRVAWCQDAGNGSDAGAESNQLRLMGFDTEDGRGERAILLSLIHI